MPEIYIYAEILTHIRQMTLFASLQTAKNEYTKILISSDKKIITLLHEGETASIYLPTQISGTANVTFPLDRKTEISTRVQIDDLYELTAPLEESSGIEVPWSAPDLTPQTSIKCKECQETILAAGQISTWKDLPSESWAELMDFWFCHKPHDGDEDHDLYHAGEAKGFSATSRVTVAPGEGLVDIVSFLLHPSNCNGLKTVPDESNTNVEKLHCTNCESIIGSSMRSEANYRLYKSRLLLQRDLDGPSETYSAATFICAQILSLIENVMQRKVVVHASQPDDSSGLLLWIFNPDIYYSSSRKSPPTAYRAMKVFYKTIDDAPGLLDEHTTTLEELILPVADVTELSKTLEESTAILPQSARMFQDWNVGLLDRYEKNASATKVMDQNPLSRKSGGIKFSGDQELPPGFEGLYS